MSFKTVYKIVASLIIVLSIVGCIIIEEEEKEKYVIHTQDYKYDLLTPSRVFKLPGKLEEISGVSYWKDNILLCIEDETGRLYLYNHKDEEIIQVIKFGKKGDYEGVANDENRAYVIKSTGKLYHFDIKDEPDVTKVDLPFTSKNDLEGITRGHKKDELYIACKRSPDLRDNDLKGRAVYQYNIKKDKVKPKPYIHLTTEVFENALKEAGIKPSKHMPFMPSGIALHPHTEEVFLISSVGKLLLVLDKTGKIRKMIPLLRSLYRQPEGITFDTDGNLFIASEGRGLRGYILKFENQLTNQKNVNQDKK
jgi:uncharacterized protein YjiK